MIRFKSLLDFSSLNGIKKEMRKIEFQNPNGVDNLRKIYY